MATELAPGASTPRAGRIGKLHRASQNWTWAFVAQGISSATSLGLSLIVGRTLGASGLGVVFAGFSAYVMLLALHRALVTTPLMSTSSSLGEEDRIRATRTAVGATLAIALSCTGLMALLGAATGGPVGRGLLIFAPWLVPAFAQELFRSSLVRDGRGRQAALTDVAWLGTMLVAAIIAARMEAVWAVVAAWGIGSVVAAIIGGVWMRARPTSLSLTRTWFRRVAFPFGRWLALQEGSFVAGYYVLIVVLTAILGAAEIGGFRAADSVFSPFTLLAPALMLAGLPATSRALAQSREKAVALATLISGVCVVVTVAYVGVMLLWGARVLTIVYGSDFEPYSTLVVPLSISQLALALGVGFPILLRAEQRGRANLVAGTAVITTSLVASPLLAWGAGIAGAAWGLTLGVLTGSAFVIFFGLRGPRVRARDVPRANARPSPR